MERVTAGKAGKFMTAGKFPKFRCKRFAINLNSNMMIKLYEVQTNENERATNE
jgi:hypothetical protein